MSFELTVSANTPLTGSNDLEEVAKTFLTQIGYLTKGSEPEIPYKLFVECFLKRPDKAWLVDELAFFLKASKPTIYRHLNKLKGLDILEEVPVPEEERTQAKKAYKLRYGNLSRAWNFVEAHVEVYMENYRKTVDHLQRLSEKEK